MACIRSLWHALADMIYKERTKLVSMISQRRALVILGLILALLIFLYLLPQKAIQALLAGLLAQRALVLLLLVFSLVTLSLLWSAGQQVDVRVFLYFNLHRLRTPGLDRLMFLITQIGNGLLGLSSGAILYMLDYRILAVKMIFGMLTLWLIVETIKAITNRTRPFRHMEEVNVVGWRERGRSFPSGHTAQTFFLSALIIHHFALSLWGSLPLYSLAAIVGFTRIYIGMHYPRDVLGGAILGGAWGILPVLIDPYLESQFF